MSDDKKLKGAQTPVEDEVSVDQTRRGVIKTIAWGTPAFAVVTLSKNSLAKAASPPLTTIRPTTTPFPRYTSTTYRPRRTTTTPFPTTPEPRTTSLPSFTTTPI